jgi:hypothetical protein
VSERAGRYQRSFGGMVTAMVVLVVLLVAWLGFRALTSSQPPSPVHAVSYADDASAAAKAADFALLAPPRLPSGWRATTVRYTGQPRPHWHLGVLTDENRYVGLEQGHESVGSSLTSYVDSSPSRGPAVRIVGTPWQSWRDSKGDLALVRRQGGTTTLVVGHLVPRPALLSYVAGLRHPTG